MSNFFIVIDCCKDLIDLSFFTWTLDIDECENGEAECAPHSECVNVPGAYYCQCKRGFWGHCDACEGKQQQPQPVVVNGTFARNVCVGIFL